MAALPVRATVGVWLSVSVDVAAVSARELLWRRWVIATTLGEPAGFSIPATVGAVAYALDVAPALFFVALVVADAGEGALLAVAQAYVLRRELAGFDRRALVAATAVAAAFAWSLGLLPSSRADADRLRRPPRAEDAVADPGQRR